MACLQAELRRAQQLAVELRKEVQLKKQLAERKTKYVRPPFVHPVSVSRCRIEVSSSFSYSGSGCQVFILHNLWPCASSLCTPFSFVFLCITSLHLGLTLAHCHVLIAPSCSVFLSACLNHLGLASLVFSLTFTTPALISVIFTLAGLNY